MRKPRLVPVHAMESDGVNRLPAAFAAVVAERLDLEVEVGIVQANVVAHTGAGEWQRMLRPALFDGKVEAERDYVVVDDFVGQGGTLANLRGHLMEDGGHVLAVAALTGRGRRDARGPAAHAESAEDEI
jgi:adenine/guanine phosphoribosyltransferase-like PRPP-binding protein